MIGTIVNTATIVIGSLLGLLIKGGIPKRFDEMLMKALGLSVLFVGIEGSLKTTDTLLLIISLVIGALIGEGVDIDKRLNELGQYIEKQFKKSGKGGNIAEGFVSASLLFCVGSMAIVGAIQSGLEGNHTMLYIKSMLDGITSIIYTSTMGIGVIFSAVPVFLYQGFIALSSSFLGTVLDTTQIANIGGIGSVLIIGLGLNILGITKIKVGNLLPAVFIPMIYYIVRSFF
ncbi:hypothetical protein CS063_15385 [Sporanaerobium hydrogeniformans]|uniref:Uncharacterized protein n=1 Tax=Sporanaerobium hydrogeniformans TaxID=3072179 RepID=A0AC61D9R7_9FIRM|nr:DUF554 domain-containing protein [Sporanaerobium hydrogeniformans]PHV69505.1 hypothetical protein CS063_15385 [Sporanaerobium hydrogeniformans]